MMNRSNIQLLRTDMIAHRRHHIAHLGKLLLGFAAKLFHFRTKGFYMLQQQIIGNSVTHAITMTQPCYSRKLLWKMTSPARFANALL
jgi:hypothetical protein